MAVHLRSGAQVPDPRGSGGVAPSLTTTRRCVCARHDAIASTSPSPRVLSAPSLGGPRAPTCPRSCAAVSGSRPVPCYCPLRVFHTPATYDPATRKRVPGSVFFSEAASGGDGIQKFIPCGQCRDCRLERSRQWAVRCMNEAQLHSSNSFITLTYDDQHLPADRSLHYRDFQLFMKRVRARFRARVRFFMAGEYGEQFARPHFHACLFGLDFPDREYVSQSPGGTAIYRSAILESLWPHGFSSVGDVTFESAAYVARYCMKKINGARALAHYTDPETGVIRTPEFAHMSLKPGVGAEWLARFRSDVYPHGKIVVNGVECKPPRYYDKKFQEWDEDAFDQLQYGRHVEALSRDRDDDYKRRAAKAQVSRARASLLKRNL